MSGKSNEHFENLILALVVGGLLVAASLYCVFLFWPYVVFICLPIIIGSVVVGVILRMATAQNERGEFQYKNLAIAFPVMIALTLLVFFAQSGRGIKHEWPEVNQIFNEYRSSTYADSPFDSLKRKARVPVIYDRQELGWMVFFCLFFGGPIFFWFLARNDEAVARKVSEELALERTKHIRERVDKKERELDEALTRGLKNAQEKVVIAERARAQIVAENQILRTKVEFTVASPKGIDTAKTGGVLDSDIL